MIRPTDIFITQLFKIHLKAFLTVGYRKYLTVNDLGFYGRFNGLFFTAKFKYYMMLFIIPI